MEGVYEKLIGNSGKLSVLGHLICYFSNCFQKSSGSRSFVVVAAEGGLKKAQVIPCSADLPVGRVPGVSRPAGAVRGAERPPCPPGARASSALPAGSWSRVAFCAPV